jgi:hypothetical protein
MSAGFLEWFSEEARRLYGEVSFGTQMDEHRKTDRLIERKTKRQNFDR